MADRRDTSLPRIVFEDDSIIVIDKPAGMPCASLKEGERGTLAAWLNDRRAAQAGVGRNPLEAGLANRIDNGTSGLVIAAKSTEAHENLRAQLSGGSARKRYLALVIGDPPARGMTDVPIAHHRSKAKRMVACETKSRAAALSARPAHTSFEVVERLELDGAHYALLSVMIRAGVRHQIRVHLAHLGFPISGDPIYRSPGKRGADPLAPPRQMLHSARLSLAHPASGEIVSFEAPLPPDFTKAISRLSARRNR
ncbi:MAG: RluA family pseudouridine synthase [Proteobacteria bacterium]|nr:RluA family pseudouridine synthase [Pseudomonadota bacterium]